MTMEKTGRVRVIMTEHTQYALQAEWRDGEVVQWLNLNHVCDTEEQACRVAERIADGYARAKAYTPKVFGG